MPVVAWLPIILPMLPRALVRAGYMAMRPGVRSSVPLIRLSMTPFTLPRRLLRTTTVVPSRIVCLKKASPRLRYASTVTAARMRANTAPRPRKAGPPKSTRLTTTT